MAEIGETRRAGDRTRLAVLAIALLVAGSAFSMLFSVTTGASNASILDVIGNIAGSEAVLSVRDRIIIVDIRLPRAILGSLIRRAGRLRHGDARSVPQSAARCGSTRCRPTTRPSCSLTAPSPGASWAARRNF